VPTFSEHIAGLATLRSFDPHVFVGDSNYSQEFCDFMLALALAYNDYRDVFIAHVLLDDETPSYLKTPTSALGEFAGIKAHLMRALMGILHELLVVIEKNREIVESQQFARLEKHLRPKARAAWTNVRAATGQKPASNPQTRLLVFARNNVSFHYGPKALGLGFRSTFTTASAKSPYVSAGSQMATTRFYFADAAAESYIRNIGDPGTVQAFFTVASPVLKRYTRVRPAMAFSIHACVSNQGKPDCHRRRCASEQGASILAP
jgi:hypothetical protein